MLLGYGGYVAVRAVREGATGPEEVSNLGGLVLEPLIFLAFGAALLLVGHGLWRARRWARAPFVLGQLVLGLIGVELAQGDSDLHGVGIASTVLALVGVVVVLTPAVTAELGDGPDRAD